MHLWGATIVKLRSLSLKQERQNPFKVYDFCTRPSQCKFGMYLTLQNSKKFNQSSLIGYQVVMLESSIDINILKLVITVIQVQIQ